MVLPLALAWLLTCSIMTILYLHSNDYSNTKHIMCGDAKLLTQPMFQYLPCPLLNIFLDLITPFYVFYFILNFFFIKMS